MNRTQVMLRHYVSLAARGFVRRRLYRPVAYYYLDHWLQGYAYRISLNPLYFLAAGGVALLVAWATVYGNTLRLARTNPVHALRYE